MRKDHPFPTQAEWPLKLPITAIAGEGDISLSDADLREWEMETKRKFKLVRLPGGASYVRDPSGAAAVVGLMRDTADHPDDDDANYSDSDDSFEDPAAAAQRAREAAHKIESDNPFSLDAYYPLTGDGDALEGDDSSAALKSSALVVNSVLGKFTHNERRITGPPPLPA